MGQDETTFLVCQSTGQVYSVGLRRRVIYLAARITLGVILTIRVASGWLTPVVCLFMEVEDCEACDQSRGSERREGYNSISRFTYSVLLTRSWLWKVRVV